jgi:predicted nucleotidyltransferase
MRLSSVQAQAIVAAARAVAGDQARVLLFGSRTRDEVRGGDIDLLIQLPTVAPRPAWLAAQISAHVQRALGERRVDVLLMDPHTEIQPVHRAALQEALLLP